MEEWVCDPHDHSSFLPHVASSILSEATSKNAIGLAYPYTCPPMEQVREDSTSAAILLQPMQTLAIDLHLAHDRGQHHPV
mmetsp:Transcript_56418/g.168859  ORF Transcript_56418/g.168859 Transcript_56418/m.168859 type:complete len:80 (-) Transcript_56418:1235-1474(-)